LPFLKTIQMREILPEMTDTFPFSLEMVQSLGTLELTSPVTFFVGENGSGKSTLLEALAVGMNLPAIGSHDLAADKSLEHAHDLVGHMRLGRTARHRSGFFFRAEDFMGFGKRMKALVEEMDELAAKYPQMLGQKMALIHRYGENLDDHSHGEGFLKVFKTRLVPNGLYMMDEPETPLSPLRQLGLLALIKEMVSQNCQFLIATHSPILMAFPGATIYSFDQMPVAQIDYDAVPHVHLTKMFMKNPQSFIARL